MKGGKNQPDIIFAEDEHVRPQTGNNRQAAIVAGINTRRTKCLAYIYSGILAAITGMVLTARLQSGQTTCGEGFELDAIAGAIIGGASLGGGGGSIAGTVCGIMFTRC